MSLGAFRWFIAMIDGHVEHQPFRSMGLVSVIIVSGLFALRLPLVLL